MTMLSCLLNPVARLTGRLIRAGSPSALCALAALTATTAFANPPTDTPRPNFKVTWGIFTSPMEVLHGSRIDWVANTDFGGARVSHDTILLYEHEFVEDARSRGIAIMYTDPDFWTRVRGRMQTMFNQRMAGIPTATYACLDVEFLAINWGGRTGGPSSYPVNGHGTFQYDAWYTYMRQHRAEELQGLSSEAAEEVLAQTYRVAVREFFLRIIQEAKEMAPQVKWGFYGYPNRRYNEYCAAAPNNWTQFNDDQNWMMEASDVIFPAVYTQIQAVPDDSTTPRNFGQWPASFLAQTIRCNIREFRRCAGPDKEVICFVGIRYTDPLDQDLRAVFMEPLDLDLAIRLPYEAGADGVIIWDMINDEGEFNALQQYMTAQVNPYLINMFGVDPNYQPLGSPGDDPGSGGGGGGSGDDSGGGGSSGGGGPTGGGGESNGGGGSTGGGGESNGGGGSTGGGGGSTGGGGGGDTGGGGSGGPGLPPPSDPPPFIPPDEPEPGDTPPSGGGGETGGNGSGGSTGGGSTGGGSTGGGSGGGGDAPPSGGDEQPSGGSDTPPGQPGEPDQPPAPQPPPQLPPPSDPPPNNPPP